MPKIYPKGMITKTPSAKAPDFVVANLSIKNAEFVPFLQEHGKNGWVNLSILRGKDGSLYSVVDEFEPKKSQEVSEIKKEIKEKLSGEPKKYDYPEEEINPEDIPF